MKKLLSVVTFLALVLSLTACDGGEKKAASFAPAADARTLLASGAFSEELTPIDTDIACALYGIDEGTVKDAAVYGSTGTTAEELAIFTFSNSDGAEAALRQLQYRVADRTESMTDYLPGEVPKLERAIVTGRNGDSVLLAVANDYGPIHTFLGE